MFCLVSDDPPLTHAWQVSSYVSSIAHFQEQATFGALPKQNTMFVVLLL